MKIITFRRSGLTTETALKEFLYIIASRSLSQDCFLQIDDDAFSSKCTLNKKREYTLYAEIAYSKLR